MLSAEASLAYFDAKGMLRYGDIYFNNVLQNQSSQAGASQTMKMLCKKLNIGIIEIEFPPDGSIDAVGMVSEGLQGSRILHVPKLDAVIPAACQKQIPLRHIPAYGIHLQSSQKSRTCKTCSLTGIIQMAPLKARWKDNFF